MKRIGKNLVLLAGAITLVALLALGGRAAIQSVNGLAVAQSSTQWNNLKDAAQGNNLTSGLAAIGLYGFDGTNWDRLLTTSGSLDFNLKTSSITLPVSGTVTATVTFPTSGTGFYAIKRVDIANSSVNLAFGFTPKKVSIETLSTNADEICVDWIGGTAVCPGANTAGDDRISAGSKIILDDYAATSVSVIAASGTQTVYVRAWQ